MKPGATKKQGNSPGRGTRPKSTIRLSLHMGLVPRSTALSRCFFHPFSLAKIPSNYHEKDQITSPKPLFRGRLVKLNPFLDFSMQIQLIKSTPKTPKMAEPIGSFWSSPPPLWGNLYNHNVKDPKINYNMFPALYKYGHA